METVGIAFVVPAFAILTQSDIADKYPALQPVLHFFGNPSPNRIVVGGAALLVAVFFIKNLFLAFLGWRQSSFSFGVRERLSHGLFAVYLRQPYEFHLQRNSAQLIHHAFDEVSVFTSSVLQPTMILIGESLVLLGLCGLLLAVEPVGAAVVMSVLGASALGFYAVTGRHIARWGEARHRHEGLRIQHLQQGLGSAKDVILLGREQDFLDQYQIHNAQTARVARYQFTLMQLPRLWLELLAVSGLSILVVTMMLQNQDASTVLPTLALFAAVAFRVMPSVNRLLNAVQSLNYSLPVIEALHNEFKLGWIAGPVAAAPQTKFEDTLALRDVSYTYTNADRAALQHISLVIRRGETVGFVGTSGAGKSTLVDVMLGLLSPREGEVRVDGRDIRLGLRAWQNQIGYVPQSIFLTDDSLRRNVAFGIPDSQIDETAVWRAIRAAQLEDFVESLPGGLATVVGERGVRLSGGQRQRIGIARALYHEPGVLVLDEATSSLDTATEAGVMEAVRALQGSKTIIIVAHRLSTVEMCTRLYRLEDGEVVGEGTFEVVARLSAGPAKADAGATS